MEKIEIEKLNRNGQGIGFSDQYKRQIRIWNALPGETVAYEVIRKKKSYVEAVAIDIKNKSGNRVEPREDLRQVVVTSPLQHISIESELEWKSEKIHRLFKETVPSYKLDDFSKPIVNKNEYEYRNKMEFSFYGDEDGIHAAFYARGSHKGKIIVEDSALAIPNINKALAIIVEKINDVEDLKAGDLKSVIIRANMRGEVVFGVFSKKSFSIDVEFPEFVKGGAIYYSDPKSPMAKPTEAVQTFGELSLTELINGKKFEFGLNSFFQINISVFEEALKDIGSFVPSNSLVVDYYSGVGSIGLSLSSANNHFVLVEENAEATEFARKNAILNDVHQIDIFRDRSEKLLNFIDSNRTIIFDPPREGLHKNVIKRILKKLPPRIIYLSCNPETQSEDVAKLTESEYEVTFHRLYNFFPKTPHVESLIVLDGAD